MLARTQLAGRSSGATTHCCEVSSLRKLGGQAATMGGYATQVLTPSLTSRIAPAGTHRSRSLGCCNILPPARSRCSLCNMQPGPRVNTRQHIAPAPQSRLRQLRTQQVPTLPSTRIAVEGVESVECDAPTTMYVDHGSGRVGASRP